MTHTYEISGMTCGGCVTKAKSELLKLPDVLAAEVQLTAPQATITMQRHIPLSTLQDALSRAGKYTIQEQGGSMPQAGEEEKPGNSYLPIFLIFAYILLTTSLAQLASGSFHPMQWMSWFMAGFFLVFSFFKLMNIKGFAEGYRSYDIVARSFPVYGFIYPFLELGLGVAYLVNAAPLAVNVLTLIVMSVSTIGVMQSLVKKSPFQCACLGTVIQLPLSKVTLFEDLLMVAMSMAMIVTQLAAN